KLLLPLSSYIIGIILFFYTRYFDNFICVLFVIYRIKIETEQVKEIITVATYIGDLFQIFCCNLLPQFRYFFLYIFPHFPVVYADTSFVVQRNFSISIETFCK